jgi:hypothetical protein
LKSSNHLFNQGDAVASIGYKVLKPSFFLAVQQERPKPGRNKFKEKIPVVEDRAF